MVKEKLVVGNWKMELSYKAELEVARAIGSLMKGVNTDKTSVVVCPSYTSLTAITEVFKKSKRVEVGAQNVHWEEKGAWTGQVSVKQISSYVDWCIVGHSEIRALTHESDDIVQQKSSLLMQYGVSPIVCIGESKEEYDADKTMEKITEQARAVLNKATRTSLTKMVIAYEPIWAIGTGEMPDPNDVAGVILLIKKIAVERFGNEAAQRLRILYGGSVKADNVAQYVDQPGIDGVLVGGASVQPMKFVQIVKAVQQSAE
jgi:triosephosphate isomerase